MYKVQPKGINIKQNERDVPDGFLQESINLQWKDGAFRPIPDRLFSGIPNSSNITGGVIMHKVSDEDQVNVLTFSSGGVLSWFGTIIDGVYSTLPSAIVITGFPTVTDFDSLSFTILNGLIYFMSSSQEFYYRLQYNQITEEYEVKDMYAWKSLIPFYPVSGTYSGTRVLSSETTIDVRQCGVILIRFTLVLKTGEEVLHSPIYPFYLFSVNIGTTPIAEGEIFENIHTLINTNLEFNDTDLLEEEVSAINVYASVPYYLTTEGSVATTVFPFNGDNAKGEIIKQSDEPLYLIHTIDNPGTSVNNKNVLLYAGEFDINLTYGDSDNISNVNIDTIAAGSILPVDNFSYHKIYGKVTSNNGRLIIEAPKTVLSHGHIRALALSKIVSKGGLHIDTEDGNFIEPSYDFDASLGAVYLVGNTESRGVLSYPDSRATYVCGNTGAASFILCHKSRASKAHNLACSFNFDTIQNSGITSAVEATEFTWTFDPTITIEYGVADDSVLPSTPEELFYTSENRFQLSESGEFSVWPAINSYRVGEGKIMFAGSNSVDPANSDYIAPLLIGTSDGIYTANFDPTGTNLIQSITKTANLPALSDKNVLIDQNLVYVSDKGLIVINNGRVTNITEEFFPDKGNGDFPSNETVYPNYDQLTTELSGNDYKVSDIVDYMKKALFSYDGRRNNIWCSNPDENFSLIYNLQTRQWTMSTLVFNEVIDFNSTIVTDEGDIYSRYLVRKTNNAIFILSGEDSESSVETHLLTRPIKIQSADQYKKIERLISRCVLHKTSGTNGFTFGVWGKQDLNKNKVSIPLIALDDTSSNSFPNNVRQDIPVGRMKGKYKTITILQGGRLTPDSSIDYFEITAIPVENNILR